MNNCLDIHHLNSSTAPGAIHFEASVVPMGTPSPRAVFSPWAECSRKIMALPFYKGQASISQASCVFACHLVQATWELSREFNLPWEAPLINSNDRSEIVLEWWRGSHEMTLFVKENQATYLKAWGTDIYDEMDEGGFDRKGFESPLTLLWLWLHR